LVISSLFIGFLSVFLYLAEKKNVFGKWKDCYKQRLIGILFGNAAVVATKCGSKIGGITAISSERGFHRTPALSNCNWRRIPLFS